MASVRPQPGQKSFPYGLGLTITEAKRGCFGFGWHPRPNVTLFCLAPICLNFGARAEYWK